MRLTRRWRPDAVRRWIAELWYQRAADAARGRPAVAPDGLRRFRSATRSIQHAERAVGAAPACSTSPTRPAPCAVRSSRVTSCCRVFGMQGSATVLALAAGAGDRAALPGRRGRDAALSATAGRGLRQPRRDRAACDRALPLSSRWLRLPPGLRPAALTGALSAGERLLTVREGRHRGRRRHRSAGPRPRPASPTATRCRRRRCSTSGTCARSRIFRCCRWTGPTRVLVIGFGVGNSTHAATLHPSVERVDVADLSATDPRARRLLSRRQPRRPARSARHGLRQRRPAASADAAARRPTT